MDELCALKHLNEVSLLSNPVARRLHYRTQVLCRLTNVTVLDGVGVSEEERARIRAMVQDQEVCVCVSIAQVDCYLVEGMCSIQSTRSAACNSTPLSEGCLAVSPPPLPCPPLPIFPSAQ